MPFSVKLAKAVICPPKCGTTTIQHVLDRLDPDNQAPHHATQTEMIALMLDQELDPTAFEWAICIRRPLPRLLSGIQSLCAANSQLDHVMEEAAGIGHKPAIIFQPQRDFLDPSSPIKVAALRMDMLVFKFLSWPSAIPHLNRTRRCVSDTDIMRHRLWPQAEARAEGDFALWHLSAYGGFVE